MVSLKLILYYFYIDESGVEGLVSDSKKKNLDSDWFTTGGIIVHEKDIKKFEQVYDTIIKTCFIDKGIKLDSNFKLHYQELRQKVYPYNQITDLERYGIANTIFDFINSFDCSLISASINKVSHDAKYEWPVNVRAYTLLICLERFQFFLEEKNSEGKAIYERLTNSLRRMITEELRQLQNIPNFSHLTKLDKIKGKIINGDPTKEKILQFSDFFVYAPQIKQVTDQRSEERWNQIKGKYYQLDSSWNRRGYVVIT